jgi:hypothetical protein
MPLVLAHVIPLDWPVADPVAWQLAASTGLAREVPQLLLAPPSQPRLSALMCREGAMCYRAHLEGV